MTLFNRVCVIVALKYDLTRRGALNDRSLEAFVAGITRIREASVHTSDSNAHCASDSCLRNWRTENEFEE